MNMLSSLKNDSIPIKSKILGKSKTGKNLDIFTEIYEEDTNIVIWQRRLQKKIIEAASSALIKVPDLELSEIVTSQTINSILEKSLSSNLIYQPVIKDISTLVDIFCNLFLLEKVGIRLSRLDRAMCPRFHVDNVPCRLVTTYIGIATEWLKHDSADRTKLGHQTFAKKDEESGIFKNKSDIQYLNRGDVALLKGEAWQGNKGGGLIHRSPQIQSSSPRLLLTIDFI